MPVEAYCADKWKQNADTSITPDGVNTIVHFEAGNSYTDITGTPAPDVDIKVRGNLRNLSLWKLDLTDATWAQYSASNLVWWLLFYVRDESGNVTSTNANTTLTNQEWNALLNYLQGNGFDTATLVRTDTRGMMMQKVLAIFRTQAKAQR